MVSLKIWSRYVPDESEEVMKTNVKTVTRLRFESDGFRI
jgi:hypothetical protein